MIRRFSIFILVMFLVGAAASFTFSEIHAEDNTSDSPVNIYFFWGEGCPHCAQEKAFLATLGDKYPQVIIKDYEVYYHPENQEIMKQMANLFGFEPQYVPMTVIGDKYWIGFRDEYTVEIEDAVLACFEVSCEVNLDSNPQAGPIQEEVDEPVSDQNDENIKENDNNASQAVSDPVNIINVPFIGKINLEEQSALVSTVIIGLVDGFNPCSLWVLSVLLAITLHSGSRTKIIIVGSTFLLVTTLVYGLFITGVFTLFSYLGYLKWIQLIVALIAFTFGVVNIKDYFWYKEGVSFTISDKHKPKIYQNMRSTVVNPRSIIGLIGSTAALAVGVSLVSFACTAGFPVIWSNLMIANNVRAWNFVLLLGLYMLIYLMDELGTFGFAVVTMKASKLEEKHGRLLKLISGMVILALGLVMLINPKLMNRIDTSLLVFAVALSATWAIYIIHQRILPRFGIYIGSGLKDSKQIKHKKRH